MNIEILRDAAGHRSYTLPGPADHPGTLYHEQPSGTWYPYDTPAPVVAELEVAIKLDRRIRVWLGDKETGKAWPEEYDVIGKVSRSMGPIKVPILLENNTSQAGGAVLTSSVVAIAHGPGTVRAYEHPGFDLGTWTIEPSKFHGYKRDVCCNDELVARFKTEVSAQRYIGFMTGLRWTK